ncbi:hypothetical protein CVT26_002836 [Gymnopilus dilepis]|uniref:F-box domain-containing protein n=1 Tax=Gymnopilus dilepis TaxID=231916 RepID=A0A409VT76_9AGAR|nr:hypothetical protein CVT26_002836 [Gymnopilus dilepis]
MNMPTSPVRRLSQDVLHFIFLANAEEAEIVPCSPQSSWYEPGSPLHPLITTRRSSQVCREWRQVILSSASLWGRLLDMDALQQEKPHWREEVLHRAGSTAPLWISRAAKINPHGPPPPAVMNFLFWILYTCWERIEILVLRIEVEDFIGWTSATQMMMQSAPALRRFTFLPPLFIDVDHRVLVPSMFSNNAPCLQEFVAPILHFESTSKFTSLRSLTTSFHRKFSTLTGVISCMPLLEELAVFPSPGPPSVHEFDLDQLLRSTPNITLPRLKDLLIQGTLPACLLLAKVIEPAAGCALNFEGDSGTGEVFSGTVLAALGRLFNKYFTAYFNFYHETDTDWTFHVGVTEFMVDVKLETGLDGDLPSSFQLSWENPSSSQGEEIIRALFFPSLAASSSSSSRESTNAPRLLTRFAAVESLSVWNRLLESVKPCVREIFAAFTGLRTLRGSKDDLSFLLLPPAPLITPAPNSNTDASSDNNSDHPPASTAPSPVFPKLHTLTWSHWALSTSDITAGVIPILQKRVEEAYKLRLLAFSGYGDLEFGLANFEVMMQEYVGPLVGRVRWRDGQDVVELWAEERAAGGLIPMDY